MAWYEADNLVITVGSVNSGVVSDTYTNNGVHQVLNEVAGALPAGGFDYEYRYAAIPGLVTWFRVLLNGYYDGNPAHVVRMQAWDYNTSTWTFLFVIPDGSADNSYISHDLDAADYVSGGAARIRFYHASNGSAGHYLYIDMLNLEDRTAAYVTTTPPTTLPPTLAPTTTLTTLAPTTTLTTPALTTLATTTLTPTTLVPTLVPTTLASTTLAPTTLAPTTLVPTTVPPGVGLGLTPLHMILKRNIAGQKVPIFAWDSNDERPFAGDATNIQAYISIDGGAMVLLNDANPTEIGAVKMPGVYIFDLTQAETDGSMIIIYPFSITIGIVIAPLFINTLLSAYAWIRTA
jgi:hypothetical protein